MAPRRHRSKKSQQDGANPQAEANILISTEADAVRPRQKHRSKRAGSDSGVDGSSSKVPALHVEPVQVSPAQVLAAVKSLYEDELKPVGRILRKRIVELWPTMEGEEAQEVSPDVSIEQVHAVCCAHPSLTIESEKGGDFSALLVDCKQSFADVYDSHDKYPSEMWSQFQAYFASPCGQEMSLPGGRYACAQALVAFDLPCLSGYSLGSVSHIVQLALSQKKILGYMNGSVVAYSRSQSKVKEQLASEGHPLAAIGLGFGMRSVASLEEARRCMQQILSDALGRVPLSNIKRLFRSKFELELSETSFGFSKLSDMFSSDDLKDICTTELQKSGYVVVETSSKQHGELDKEIAGTDRETSRRVVLCPDEPLWGEDDTYDPHMPLEEESATRSPLKDSSQSFLGGVPLVQRTFIQYTVPRTPLPGSSRRSRSLPKDMQFGQNALEGVECMEECSGRTSRQSTAPSSGCGGDETPPSSLGDIRTSVSELSSAEEKENEWLSGTSTIERVNSWADEPLQFEDVGEVADTECFHEPSHSMTKWEPLAPSMLAEQGWKVKNTFYDAPPLLPTPIRTGAVYRSQSLPKEMASTETGWHSSDEDLGSPVNVSNTHASSCMLSTSLASQQVFRPPIPPPTYEAPSWNTISMPSAQSTAFQSPSMDVFYFMEVTLPCAMRRDLLQPEQHPQAR